MLGYVDVAIMRGERRLSRRRLLAGVGGTGLLLPSAAGHTAAQEREGRWVTILALDPDTLGLTRTFETGDDLHVSVEFSGLRAGSIAGARPRDIQIFGNGDVIHGAEATADSSDGFVQIPIAFEQFEEHIDGGELSLVAGAGCNLPAGLRSCWETSRPVTLEQTDYEDDDDDGWWW